MATKAKPMSKVFKTGPVPVVFSHLDALDTKFDKQGNHNITVSVEGKFKAKLTKIKTEFGKDRIISGNRINEKYGEQQTFKSTLHRDKTSFPEVWNTKAEKVSEVPGYGDVVDIRFVAKQIDVNKDKYISMYLDAVQIIENNGGEVCPFDAVEEEKEEDLPF
jgi:hypothetical protein